MSNDVASIDLKILSMLGDKLTLAQIAEQTGIAPEEIASRVDRALNSVDVLSNAQKRRLAVLKLGEIAEMTFDKLKEAQDNAVGSISNAAASAQTRYVNAIKEMEIAEAGQIQTLSKRYADQLVKIVEVAFERTLGALEERYKDIDRLEVETEFRGHLAQAAAEFDLEA